MAAESCGCFQVSPALPPATGWTNSLAVTSPGQDEPGKMSDGCAASNVRVVLRGGTRARPCPPGTPLGSRGAILGKSCSRMGLGTML